MVRWSWRVVPFLWVEGVGDGCCDSDQVAEVDLQSVELVLGPAQVLLGPGEVRGCSEESIKGCTSRFTSRSSSVYPSGHRVASTAAMVAWSGCSRRRICLLPEPGESRPSATPLRMAR